MGAHLSVEQQSMPSCRETEPADASSAAPAPSAPQHATPEDSLKADTSNSVSLDVMEAAELEKSGRKVDAAVGVMGISRNEAFEDVAMDGKPDEDKTIKCCECKRVESASRGDKLRVCGSCKVAVHVSCYVDALPAAEKTEKSEASDKTREDDETMDSAEWECDCCRRGVERRAAKCVYCMKAGGDAVLKVVEVDKDAEFWRHCGQLNGDTEAGGDVEGVKFGHIVCINWDPRHLAAHMAKQNTCKRIEKPPKVKESEDESTADNENVETEKKEEVMGEELNEDRLDAKEILMRELPSTECCLCHSTIGVRIQCRRVNCARFFHAMCAHQGNGHLELRTAGIPQFHAYCERHRECTEDIGDLLAKLITRPIRLLVGRDDMRRFGTVAKHLPTYSSASSVIRDLASLVVGYCNKGLRTCKVEPADYNVKHLQVLQFFLSHVPQLEKVYALPHTPVQDIVNDKKLFRRLERVFNPPRYSAKFPGPFSQQYTCDVCLDPFHERQHLFYCTGGDESAVPHVQHWRCTKRRSNARERERYLPVAGNTAKKKRKAISIVQDGVRTDITLPKGLCSMTDDVICGVCRASVDARGLIASRKETKTLDFDKKESKFVQNGCYINPVGAKGYSGYSHGTASTSSTRKPPRSTDSWKPNGTVSVQHAAAQQALGPPKMERINVQRTTRLLECVAQIIRLVCTLASKPDASTEKPPPSISKANGSASEAETSTVPAISPGLTVNAGITSKEDADNNLAPSTAATTDTRPDTNGVAKVESQVGAFPSPSPKLKFTRLVTPAVQALFNEAMRLVRPHDSYALTKLETAHDMLLHRSGPGVAVLRMLTQEYTRFVYIKHTRAVEKAHNQKRKRAEHEAHVHREKERKRMNLEAERALKKQMLAVRNKQRQHLKTMSK